MQILIRLGFNAMITTLANTVEAMENAPSNRLENSNINKIIKEVVVKGMAIVLNKMKTMEICFTSQTKHFDTHTTHKVTKILMK